MSAPAAIAAEIQKLAPSAIVELFVLDATSLGAEVLRFHAGTNGLKQNIVWQGETFVPYPIEATGFEISGQGQLPRPKLRVSNYMSALTALLLQYDDLIGSKLIRKRTHVKFLDAVNFPGGVNATADDEAAYPDDTFFLDRKVSETREVIEFELCSTLDLAGIQLPRRQIIQNICVWRYRGAECGYTDTRYFTANDVETDNPAEDKCGKRLKSCKCRFGAGGALPFGGMPGAGLIR